jgi:hypothetical protein
MRINLSTYTRGPKLTIYKNLRNVVETANTKDLLDCLISLRGFEIKVDGFDDGKNQEITPTAMQLACELYKREGEAEKKKRLHDVISALYDFGADINFTGGSFETPAQVAASRPEIAKIFSRPRSLITGTGLEMAAPKKDRGCTIL